MGNVKLAAVVLAGLLGAPALGHEGGVDARGTVKEIDGSRIVLVTARGEERVISLGPETRVVRGDRSVPPGDVKAGERAVVHAKDREGKLEATEIRVARKGR